MTTTTAENTIATRINDNHERWKSFYAEQIAEIKKDKSHWLDQSLSTTASILRTLKDAMILSAAFCVFVFALVFITYDGSNITLIQAQYFAKVTLIASFGAALAVCLSLNTGKFKSLKRKVATHYANNMNDLVRQRDLVDDRIMYALRSNNLDDIDKRIAWALKERQLSKGENA